jgi:hypothetical protein
MGVAFGSNSFLGLTLVRLRDDEVIGRLELLLLGFVTFWAFNYLDEGFRTIRGSELS